MKHTQLRNKEMMDSLGKYIGQIVLLNVSFRNSSHQQKSGKILLKQIKELKLSVSSSV